MKSNAFQTLKGQFTNGSMTLKLVLVNCVVFLVLQLILGVSTLAHIESNTEYFIEQQFALNTHWLNALTHPWTLFTSIFIHLSFSHVLFNMVFLYFAGTYYEQLFGAKKLVITYILGGLTGSFFEILSAIVLPENSSYVLGASGSIMAIFAVVAFYRPQTPVSLFGLISVPIYVFALFFIIKDIVGIVGDDDIAHFAHIGGALFGFLATRNIMSSNNPVNLVSNLFAKNTVQKTQKRRPKTDEQYNAEKREKQMKIDAILDKISKSGYESLTKNEKDFLFNQSNDE
jgi:membrane associated rhomboid family serine protease